MSATPPPSGGAPSSFPMMAYLDFCPGGVTYAAAGGSPKQDAFYNLSDFCPSADHPSSNVTPGVPIRRRSSFGHNSPSAAANPSSPSPDAIVHKAKMADDRLRQYALLFGGKDPTLPHFLPSLSVLADAAFGKLTGVPPENAKAWADAMVLQYFEAANESMPETEEDIYNVKPTAMKTVSETTASVLRHMLQQAEQSQGTQDITSPNFRPRPCGYVFKRGDIAWNCRTCQADSTCVICDKCFRNSNHDGHEVYFHRTTPGGCCDCGDAEAWKSEGCCDAHRPTEPFKVEAVGDDPEEAARMSDKAQNEAKECLKNLPTALPPKLAAALGVVVGAAVHCITQAVDGAGIGADPVQWKLRWADDGARLKNRACHNEDYRFHKPVASPMSFLTNMEPLPTGYRLHLRLHNDDVHTFDEVIDALHEPRHSRRNSPANEDQPSPSLVTLRESATEMTHHVDADGQVVVKSYASMTQAMQGFRRLKSRGLHCAVVGSAQMQLELRARALAAWLGELSSAHPAAASIVVHALVQVNPRHTLGDVHVWQGARTMPPWAALDQHDDIQACRRRFNAFPPHLASSYVTREEAELLHAMAIKLNPTGLVELTGTVPDFYAKVPYCLPSERYRKSPHALWGTLPSLYSDSSPPTSRHPLLHRLVTGQFDPRIPNGLTEGVHVVDTDLRKQQEADRITASIFAHKLPGLHMISGVGTLRLKFLSNERPPQPNPMEYRHLLATSSFRAPVSPCLLLLLLDPYPTKQLRGSIHALFLSLLTDLRFKMRFAAALGISYRPLSTLFCAGVGTEADSPLGFTVQIFTTGSIVRAMGSARAAEKLLLSDFPEDNEKNEASIGVFTSPLAHTIVRCIHTNILGATKEVNMILNNTQSTNDDDSQDEGQSGNDGLLPALTYVAGEHPLMTPLPAAPDDGFLDSRSTRHKRLPHLLRDLEYVIETPGTAIRLLLPRKFPVYQGPSLSFRGEDVLTFPGVFARLLRVAQGMDPQKRKISGGHVEYEQNRWLEAFGLSLNFAGTRDALAESLTNSSGATITVVSEDGSHLISIREAMGNMIAALLRELKLWLYREGMLETGLPVPPGGTHGAMDLSQVEALQRSTLHVSGAQLGMQALPVAPESASTGAMNVNTVALSCATSVKMTEAQLHLIESALRIEGAQRQYEAAAHGSVSPQAPVTGPVMGDWLRVPHSPLAGDSLSFHLPLHRALAKTVRSMCSVVVPESVRTANSRGWWKLPVLDEVYNNASADPNNASSYHPLVPLIRPTLRSSNCRVVWSAGPDCSPQEAQRRRARSRTVSANIAVAKIIHSLADHPIRCLAAAQQIERHLWARNGSATAGMALNYSSTPLCQRFRDLDLTLVQLSAAGMCVGLGARRVFNLLISRCSMDGYLCDPERRVQGGSPSSAGGSYGSGTSVWVNPPRMQDPDHAIVLSESLFATLCVLVTELPPPPPISSHDDSWMRQGIRRELLHALVAEPRSHSEAMAAASCAVSRRDETDGSAVSNGGVGLFRAAFADVLREIGKQKTQGSSRVASGPPSFELKAECCDEYDPTFFHLRRQEHQHAMDIVARLRKVKWGNDNKEAADAYCLPLVCAPPRAHPRFLPCRLLLHLQAMDAALRRSLLFALTGGSWLPPSEPKSETIADEGVASTNVGASGTATDTTMASSPHSDVPVMTFGGRRVLHGPPTSSSFLKKSMSDVDQNPPFSKEVVAASSVSFLEVLQLLTLQVHTLEECASLHRTQPDLDDEAKSLSASLSINSYLGRLAQVPESLVDVWALRPFPHGPLKSNGSGENRGSILGLLIALYEHRSDHGAILDSEGGQDYNQGDDGHGGARTLASSGLKWLLRFVHALVDGAPSVGAAVKSATTGTQIRNATSKTPSPGGTGSWTIDENVRSTISAMLANLNDLWPVPREKPAAGTPTNDKSKEARKAAQQRVLDMMKKKQAAFAATIAPPAAGQGIKMEETDDEEADLCIICRCDDADGENNGPLGYLGHVQRSRATQMRAVSEVNCRAREGGGESDLLQKYRVVGHMGCQLRETEAMDSKPLSCLPRGTIVTVLRSAVSDKYDILARRVLVRHVVKNGQNGESCTEGWASIQSSQGYVILTQLVSMCYSNSRWGCTRPIIRQCGHAAHLRCVETHTLSLHQRAAGEQPYDGRFAANIDDGEFLCPLCKQLSNILIPRDNFANNTPNGDAGMKLDDDGIEKPLSEPNRELRNLLTRGAQPSQAKSQRLSEINHKALEDFGSHLFQAMDVPWERNTGSRRRNQRRWHPAIQRWDYEEDDDDPSSPRSGLSVRSTLRYLRQQHIAWAAVGHSAATLEAGSRGLEEVMPFGVMSNTSDPWSDYNEQNRDQHPMLLELKRTIAGAAGLFEVLIEEMRKALSPNLEAPVMAPRIVGCLLADAFEGKSWYTSVSSAPSFDLSTRERLALWSELTGLMASVPCHVARDGQVSQRSEARAAAAAMWVVRGLGTQHKVSGDPPVPLAVSRMYSSGAKKPPQIPRNWGTLDPFVSGAAEQQPTLPFRPAVASAFLYVPLLAWDLHTVAGAIMSTILVNEVDYLPRSQDLLHIAQGLLVSRIIQSVITPGGVFLPDEMEEDDVDEFWGHSDVNAESLALARLVAHCRSKVTAKSLAADSKLIGDIANLRPKGLLAGVGQAILPFARSLVLLLRACSAVIRERQRRSRSDSPKGGDADKILDSVLYGSEIMTLEDGFLILNALKGPMPSALNDTSSMWWSYIDRWLVATIGWELHHGSMGRNVVSMLGTTSNDTIQGMQSNHAPFEPAAANQNKIKRKADSDNADSMAVSRSSPGIGSARMATSNQRVPFDAGTTGQDDNEGMDVDDSQDDGFIQFFNNNGVAEADGDDSDDDAIEGMDLDDEEIVVGFPGGVLGGDTFDAGRPSGANDGPGDSSEEHSSSASEGESGSSDREFAHVSRSPIVSYQPSLLALGGIGAVRQGTFFEFDMARGVMSDLSHLGLSHRRDIPTFSLVRLPKSFVELYSIVNKVKGRDETTLMDDADEVGSSETAICLLTGAVMRSGSSRRSFSRSSRPPGACTLHARKNGSGIGIFFLVQKCTVLLMHNNKSAYSASIYVDEHGEEDPGLRRGRPLFLNEARYRALEGLWRQQGIPREVAQIRSTSDRVIRDNWY